MTSVARVVWMVVMESRLTVYSCHNSKALKVALVEVAQKVMEEVNLMEVVEVQEVRHLAKAVSFPQEG